MAKTKQPNKTNIYVGIIVGAIVVAALVVGIVVAIKNSGSSSSNNSSSSSSGSQTPSSTDYSNVDVSVSYGDYDSMETLSKNIQNGYATGQIVKIDGIVSHPATTYSVVQPNADGSQRIGTQFIIDGASESDYPADGARVVITGEVVEQSPLYFVIKTTPQYVEVTETTESTETE